MELSVLERLVLLQILPDSGSYMTIKIVRQLREELSFSEDEHEKLNFQQEGQQVKWDGELDKKMAFGAKARNIIVEALEKLDDEGQVGEQHLSLFEKFGVGED